MKKKLKKKDYGSLLMLATTLFISYLAIYGNVETVIWLVPIICAYAGYIASLD